MPAKYYFNRKYNLDRIERDGFDFRFHFDLMRYLWELVDELVFVNFWMGKYRKIVEKYKSYNIDRGMFLISNLIIINFFILLIELFDIIESKYNYYDRKFDELYNDLNEIEEINKYQPIEYFRDCVKYFLI